MKKQTSKASAKKRTISAKTEKVLGEVLTGAAVGAVTGAAKAVTDTLEKDAPKQKNAPKKSKKAESR